MRAKEFITEEELDQQLSSVMPLAYSFPSMPSSDPYQIYRFGLELASAGKAKSIGPAAQGAVVASYSTEEEKNILRASKQTKHSPKVLASKNSTEPADVNKTSPVAAKKKNRYGV